MKFLVAIDFSEASRRAYNFAVTLAKAIPNSSIVLIAVVELAHKGSEQPSHQSATAQMWMESDAKAVELFNQQRAERAKHLVAEEYNLCLQNQIPCNSHVEIGDPREIICRYIKHENIDHLVMGTRGLNPLIGVQVGSVSDYCIRNASVPVTVVK